MVKVRLVIQSYLSDALADLSFNLPALNGTTKRRLQFVKYLVHMFPDTDVEINVDAVYRQYELKEQQKIDEQMKAM